MTRLNVSSPLNHKDPFTVPEPPFSFKREVIAALSQRETFKVL